jgi:hypothetical protein
MAKKNKKEETAKVTTAVETTKPPVALNDAQEVGYLRAAHEFFTNFDRVPGGFANGWAQALDAIAIVANSLIAKQSLAGGAKETKTEETKTATPADNTVN